MQDVYDYLLAHQEEALDDLRAFCAQRSVSTRGRGMAKMAALVRARLARSGFAVKRFPLKGGFPVIYAESQDDLPPDAPTILIYNHYDVQPEGDPALWTSPPFEPTVRDGKLYARGVGDDKGHIISRLAAIDALRAVRGKLPVRIKWIIEGEEEIGSPHLDAFLLAHRERLAADGCIWEFGSFTWEGRPQVMLGLKGMVEVTLTARGANRDLHSSLAATVISPVWRLTQALSSIKDENEGIGIAGFYDAMRAPTETEIMMVHALPNDDATTLADLGLPEFALGVAGFGRHMAEVFAPTCNIQGLEAGYTGPGTKTVLPHVAWARLDLRLVPDQNPEEIFALLQAHLAEHGFTDIEATMEPGPLNPARTDPDHPFVRQVLEAVEEANGPPVVWPSSPASGPMYSFTHGLGQPVVAIGISYPASGAHAPDENIRLSDFWAGTRQIAQVLVRLGECSAAELRPTAPSDTPAEADLAMITVFDAAVFDTDALFPAPPADFDLLSEMPSGVFSTMPDDFDPLAGMPIFEMPGAEYDPPAPGAAPPAAPPPKPRSRKRRAS